MSWTTPTLGEFSERLTLLRPTFTEDGVGGQLPGAPEVVAVEWAQVDPRSGQEVIAAGGLLATMPIRFRLHYREDVDETWVLEWRGRRLQVNAPPVPEGGQLRQWLVLSAVQGGPS